MTESARHVKIVEWSDEDGAFVGHCPGIIGPCCHGPDEVAVQAELSAIVEDLIALALKDGKPLPTPLARDTILVRECRHRVPLVRLCLTTTRCRSGYRRRTPMRRQRSRLGAANTEMYR
jgi:predicted RNase H-like HicB family nuclease